MVFATSRISADAVELGNLEARVDHGDLSFQGCTPHEVAGVLKSWIKRLSEPVITRPLYEQCIIHSQDSVEAARVVAQLPDLNRRVLLHIIGFLQELAQPHNVAKTKMSAGNLALLFSPLLLRCPMDDPLLMLQNTHMETDFVYTLLSSLQGNQT